MNIGQIHIRILENKDNRFDKFIHLFRSLTGDGYGKLEKNFFIIETSMILQNYRDEEQRIFSMIQSDGQRKGVIFNMFMIN